MMKHQIVYDSFIRCLYLFNEEVLSRQELICIAQPFFCKAPEMFAWFKEFVINRREDQGYEPMSETHVKQERIEEQIIEIGEECKH